MFGRLLAAVGLPFWKQSGSHRLLAGIATSIAIRFIPTFVPEAASLFRTAVFPTEWWPLILVCFLPSFVAIELDKLIRRAAGNGDMV